MLKEFDRQLAELTGEKRRLEGLLADAQRSFMEARHTLNAKPLDLLIIREAQATKAAAAELMENINHALTGQQNKIDRLTQDRRTFLTETLPAQERRVKSLQEELNQAQTRANEKAHHVRLAEEKLATTQQQMKGASGNRDYERVLEQRLGEQRFAVQEAQQYAETAQQLATQAQQRFDVESARLAEWRGVPVAPTPTAPESPAATTRKKAA